MNNYCFLFLKLSLVIYGPLLEVVVEELVWKYQHTIKMPSSKDVMSPVELKFFQAVYSNNIPAIRALLKREKLNPNIPDKRRATHRTALLYACENQLIDLARALLKAKPFSADVDKEDLQGRHPIW